MCTCYTLRYTHCNHTNTSQRCPLAALTQAAQHLPQSDSESQSSAKLPSQAIQEAEGQDVILNQPLFPRCSTVTKINWKIDDLCMYCKLNGGEAPGPNTKMDMWAESMEVEQEWKRAAGVGPEEHRVMAHYGYRNGVGGGSAGGEGFGMAYGSENTGRYGGAMEGGAGQISRHGWAEKRSKVDVSMGMEGIDFERDRV